MNQNLFPLCFNTFCGDCFQFFVGIIPGKYFFQVGIFYPFCGRKLENMKVCSVGSFGAMERFYGVKLALPAIEVWNHTLGK